jgi:hypothetical protein
MLFVRTFFMKKEVLMNSKVYVACMAIALAAGCGAARAESSAPAKYSNAELKQMEQEAHTAQQYEALATYFRWRQEDFKQQALSEKAEWVRRVQFDFGPAEKYPRPVDSSRNRYEYFSYEAQKMSQQAAHYESLADNSK